MKCIWIINQYASTPDTGMGGRHYYLAKELALRGYDVYLITASWHHLLRSDLVEPAGGVQEVDGFKFVRIKTPRYEHAHDKRRILSWLMFALGLTRLEGSGCRRPDVVLCSSPSLVAFLGAERVARRAKCRLVFEVRDIWPLTLIEIGGISSRNPAVRLMQWIEDRAYRVSDRVISTLPRAVEHMVSRGMDRSKFCWIPNGFSRKEVEAAKPLPRAVANCFPKNGFVVGYAGTLGAANAMDVIIDAAVLLKDHPEIVFVLVGHGREARDLQSKAIAEGLDNVRFLDPVPKIQVQSVLKRFDVCFVGSTKSALYRFGTSPNKLFDYLVSGKPIIYGIDSPGYSPISDFDAGLSVLPEDAPALAAAILALYATSEKERLRMGENGRRAAFEHHEYAMLAGRLESVLFDDTDTVSC
jgi:glycosyltransferase involved in cell wall biosynthesis